MASPTGQAGTRRYTKVIQVPVTDETDQRIREDAELHRLSLAEVARTYLEAGFELADERAAARAAGATGPNVAAPV